MNYKDMSVSELEAMNQALMEQRAQILVQQRELAAVLDSKRAEDALQKDIDALQEKHKVQIVGVEGIESKESVHG